MFSISEVPIPVEDLKKKMLDFSAGALVTFEGWIRDHNEGKKVKALEYEIYDALALKQGEEIIRNARSKFSVYGLCCVHYKGFLELGGVAVWVGATASHRGEAFDACEYVIDRIKHEVPIWKKEHYLEGPAEWVSCVSCEQARSVTGPNRTEDNFAECGGSLTSASCEQARSATREKGEHHHHRHS